MHSFISLIQIITIIRNIGIMTKHHLTLLLVVLCIGAVSCGDLFFGRVQACTDPSVTPCQKWNTSVELSYYYGFNFYMCFPGSTRVMTASGPRSITQLSVGDQILAYDFELDRNTYSPVTAWLHRDTDSRVEFTTITAKGGNAYRASAGHNIAYNNNGSIGFKYADELEPGDQLISNGNHYQVQSARETSFEDGLYSPMTEASTFYIFPFQSVEANDLSRSLILVHCLAQMQDPHSKEHWIHRLLRVGDWVGMNAHHNQEHESYLHPITHLMRLVGQKHRDMRYHVAAGDQNELRSHLQALPSGGGSSSWGSGSSWGSSSSRSSWGSSSSSSSWIYGSSYASNRHQQEEKKKRQLLSVFSLLMQLNSLITST